MKKFHINFLKKFGTIGKSHLAKANRFRSSNPRTRTLDESRAFDLNIREPIARRIKIGKVLAGFPFKGDDSVGHVLRDAVKIVDDRPQFFHIFGRLKKSVKVDFIIFGVFGATAVGTIPTRESAEKGGGEQMRAL